MSLHELRHVDTDHRIFATEHELGELLDQICFPNAGRPQGQEYAHWSFGVLQACSRSTNSFGEHGDGFILPNYFFVEYFLHIDQSLGLAGRYACQRNSGPHADYLGDVLASNHWGVATVFVFPVLLQIAQLLSKASFPVPQFGGKFVLTRRDRLVFFFANAVQHLGSFFHRHRRGAVVNAHARCGFIDKVDCFIGQEAVRYKSRRQVSCLMERFIADFELVVLFVPALNPAQYFYRFINRWFLDPDWLEAPFKRGVALDIFPVVVERRRTDSLEFASGQ